MVNLLINNEIDQKNDETKNLVSVILPTYNRAQLLENCIYSVLNQTYKNLELIICDDHSNDDTENVIKELLTKDIRIKYSKNQKNFGLPINRNIGIKKAIGLYIFFIEDDMILDRNCLKYLVNDFELLIKQNIRIGGITPALITNYNTKQGHSNINLNCRESNEAIRKPCEINKFTGLRYYNFSPTFLNLQEVPDMHACSLYSKNVLDEIGGYDEKTYTGNYLYEETDLNYRIFLQEYCFYFEPKAILHHNISVKGGCRVDKIQYRYFFVINHMKFLIKNYRYGRFFMVPCSLIMFFNAGLKILFHKFQVSRSPK